MRPIFLLRVAPLSLVLFFWGTALFPPPFAAFLGGEYLANVGGGASVSAGVTPNPYNTLAEELRHREEAIRVQEERTRYDEALRELRVAAAIADYRGRALSLVVGEVIVLALVVLHLRLDRRLDRLHSGHGSAAAA